MTGGADDMRSSRFKKGMGDEMRRLNASIDFDRRLYLEDIEGSLAWADALEKRGILEPADARKLARLLLGVAA